MFISEIKILLREGDSILSSGKNPHEPKPVCSSSPLPSICFRNRHVMSLWPVHIKGDITGFIFVKCFLTPENVAAIF